MADEIIDTLSVPAASPEAAPSPSPAPVEVETPAVVPDVAPDVAPEAAPVDAPVEEAKPDTLLGGDKIEEEKPVEEAPAVETPEEVPAEEVAPLPTYEPFSLPEDTAFDAEKMNEFTKDLAEFEVNSKASHEEVQKLGQSLVDRHIAEVKRYTESLNHAWEKQKTDWKDSFLKDPEFQNRTNTVVNSALDAISTFAGDTVQQDEFRSLMESTGVGNHPAMIRLLSNVMVAKASPKPLAAPSIAPKASLSKIQKMYGSKKV